MTFHKETLAKGVDIYLGDCNEVLPILPTVDAVVTDPPYGIGDIWAGGFGSGWGNARNESQARNEWDMSPPTKELIDLILSKSDKQIIWGGNYFDLPPTRCWLIWNKPERNFSLAEAELAWTNLDMVVRVRDAPRSDTGREHPTQKPIKLMEWCIGHLRVAPKSVILDPFMGSGTTGLAAMETGMRFIGIEREERWFNLAKKRIMDSINQPYLFTDKPEVEE